MSQNITKITDYVGYVTLPLNDVQSYFPTYVFEVEKKILRGNNFDNYGLLGDAEYIALLADLDSNNNPQTQKYIDLVDGKNYIGSDGKNTVFGGLRKLLTYFVYCDYVKDNRVTNFQAGSVEVAYENAEKSSIRDSNKKAHDRWNLGVELYNNETYDYILFNQSDFPNWIFTRQYKFITQGII